MFFAGKDISYLSHKKYEKIFKIKKSNKKLKDVPGYEGWRRKRWEQIDMCRDCLNKLYNIQQAPPMGTTSMQNN